MLTLLLALAVGSPRAPERAFEPAPYALPDAYVERQSSPFLPVFLGPESFGYAALGSAVGAGAGFVTWHLVVLHSVLTVAGACAPILRRTTARSGVVAIGATLGYVAGVYLGAGGGFLLTGGLQSGVLIGALVGAALGATFGGMKIARLDLMNQQRKPRTFVQPMWDSTTGAAGVRWAGRF